ncbi:flavodoxin family protein [Bacillus sp. BH2]|uniref:flavodoxin family protein n=1 Tax=Bacillus sp. BH2 TaxID=2528958 RepID=UPI001064E456|nr:NAD(P)H-dependent oxidoreductase [Bacillus sp. BH2]TEA45662.1 flavodoxin family protein [Bacillus sp. BH2]
MKTIYAFVGSRNRNSNTNYFLNQIKKEVYKLDNNIQFEIETSRKKKFMDTYEFEEDDKIDDIIDIQNKLISADFIILASPIMVHNISSDMKLLVERCSSWGHTMRLMGKKSYVITTNYSNGHMSGINYLAKILTTFGTQVIGASNASAFYPNQLHNTEWLDKTTLEIATRIVSQIHTPVKSNEDLEANFRAVREAAQYYLDSSLGKNDYQLNKMQKEELNFWLERDLIGKESFSDVLSNLSS